MKRSKWVTGLAVWSVAGLLMTGCGSSQTASTTPSKSSGGDSSSNSAAPVHLKIMVGGMEKIIYLPAKLTETLGYFKEQGLDVELMSESAGQTAEEALIAGQVEGAVGFYDHTIDLQTKNKKLESIVQFGASPGETLIVSDKLKDQIQDLKDLKGKKIGVTGLGSSTNFLANYLVTKGGNTSKDYTPVPVGSGNTLLAAMQQGRIDLAVTTEPTVSLLKAKHVASTFIDMSSQEGDQKWLGGQYPASCLYMQNSYVEAHPDVAQKLANAFVKTMQYIHTHSAEEIADKMPPEYFAGDKAMYVNALKSSLPMFTADGKMPADGPAKVLEVLTTFNPKIKSANVKLEETYTTQFVEKATK